jgi:uncharacterized membrane protein YczE
MPRRLVQLFAGLVLYGISDSMLLLAGLGLDPWDVLHQGLSRRTGVPTGTWVIIVGAAVLLLWIPLRQRPGLGTLCNVVVIGAVIDAVLAVVSPPHSLPVRAAVMVSAVVLNGVATGMYIGAGLGPGPRDGLMTGFAARGHSLRVVRTGIEAIVLLIGWLLGGTVGIGTLLYAAAIGPLAHIFVPLFSRKDASQAETAYQPRARHSSRWGRSTPSVVSLPCPGYTQVASGSGVNRRSVTSVSRKVKSSGELVLPTPPGNSESPVNTCGSEASRPPASYRTAMLPGVCPRR